MKPVRLLIVTLLATSTYVAFPADDGARRGGMGARETRPQDAPEDDVRFLFKTDVPAHRLDVILGRPTASAVTASILAQEELEAVITYGQRAGVPEARTAAVVLKPGTPVEIVISSLRANTRYHYRLHTRAAGESWRAEEESSFQTQRPSGAPFTFTVQADSHLDYNTDPQLYLRCLANALADRPDFHIDLGDTFMTDKHRGRETAAAQYVAQRFYFGQIAHSAPLFLVLGNHDGETGRWLDGTDRNLAVWANAQRKRYFPNPTPDGFYTGNSRSDPQAGLLADYYAWEWGDALFIVLDPFWYTQRQHGGADDWPSTLGREQYDWLSATLSQSRAKFRFVFLHHLVGGFGKDSRGGAEAVPLYEWGGHEPDGTDGFSSHRPGWPMPIHQVLVRHHVNVVFHGHDHLFVKQDLDGIVYQEVPQPGHSRYDNTRSAEEYGYKSGTLLGSSGHLRIRVESSITTVAYVRAYLPGDESANHRNGTISHSYSILPY